MARAAVPFTKTERVIAENIRELREQRRMSQADLAEAMSGGWTTTTVSKVETIDGANTRHLNADELVRLSKILGVTVDEMTRINIAGSPLFVEAYRAGEAFTEAWFNTVEQARKTRHLAAVFQIANEEIPPEELEAMHPALRSSYEETFTYFTQDIMDALEALQRAHKDAAFE